MRKKLKKKLLDTALSTTGQLHWHTLFFGLLEKHSDMAEEIAIESYKLPPQEEKQMLDEILRRGKLEIGFQNGRGYYISQIQKTPRQSGAMQAS